MEELFLETECGNIEINPDIIKKYNLKKGTRSPFTRSRIVDKNGEYFIEEPVKNRLDEEHKESVNDILFTTSEAIDIAQGVDSST